MARKISFENICFGYKKDNPLFWKLSFSIEQPDDNGYIVGLMGDSGSGKSTLLKLILGTERVWSGNINIQPVGPIISYVPQDPVLFEHLTPLENALYFSKTKRFKKRFNQDLFDKMVNRLGMEKLLRSAKSINEISGGQKQRISLLRALSINPDILLLDEPLTGLDERVKYSFLVDLASSAQVCNILMVYVTHYRQEIELISDKIVFLKSNKQSDCIQEVIQEPTAEFFGKPLTLSALFLSRAYETNVLPVEIDSNGRVSLYKKDDSIVKTEYYHLSLDQDVIRFNAELGWEFVEKAKTDSYLYLQLKENDSIIILPAAKRADINGMHRILLNGSVDIYHNEDYHSTVDISNNCIVNMK
jgi:ABC-type multidrug transport system ATPase subunit